MQLETLTYSSMKISQFLLKYASQNILQNPNPEKVDKFDIAVPDRVFYGHRGGEDRR